MTDFLKTRLLDTLSDQIRKIQKVRECKGSARREATCPRCCSSAPQPGTARGPMGLVQHPVLVGMDGGSQQECPGMGGEMGQHHGQPRAGCVGCQEGRCARMRQDVWAGAAVQSLSKAVHSLESSTQKGSSI